MTTIGDMFDVDDIWAPGTSESLPVDTKQESEWTFKSSVLPNQFQVYPISAVTPTQLMELTPVLACAQNLQNATEGTAPMILSTLSSGLIRTGGLLAGARLEADKARTERKRVQGRLALEAYPQYLNEKGIKGTESTKEAFVDSHDDTVAACHKEAHCDALVCQLDTIKASLMMAISSVKSIVYGYKDSSSVSGNRV